VEKNEQQQQRRGRTRLLLILAVCAAPMLLSYLAYYVIKPEGRTNYGTLIDPRNYPIPELHSTELSGEPTTLSDFQGKWVMLQVADAACGEACHERLMNMRQLRLMQGKDMDRIERVWLLTDREPVETMLMREFDGIHMLRVDPAAVTAWLPADANTVAADHIYLIDPLGNLMMRFPKDSDPNKMKKDINKLLRASSIG
jgi:cytochrome oxidase Cu insertion factor (SCO1/SenC/PrrC family)